MLKANKLKRLIGKDLVIDFIIDLAICEIPTDR